MIGVVEDKVPRPGIDAKRALALLRRMFRLLLAEYLKSYHSIS